MRVLYRAWLAAARPIGAAVELTALAAVYFLVLTPIGLILRATGRDALLLRRPRGRTSYFSPVDMPTDPARYERLY